MKHYTGQIQCISRFQGVVAVHYPYPLQFGFTIDFYSWIFFIQVFNDTIVYFVAINIESTI